MIYPNKKFCIGNIELDFAIVDFWIWNQSELLENRTRGVLAEYIVRQALGLTDAIRLEWDEVDLKTEDNTKIEVKSAAYIQSWKQTKLSSIKFDISPRRKLLLDNSYSHEIGRVADIYVFCLLDHKDRVSINPMNLEQWKFYVLPTHVLNEKLPNQKSVGLNTLFSLGCEACNYEQLMEIINQTKSKAS